MRVNNYRFDEFLGIDESILIQSEQHVIPTNSPYYLPLQELPKKETPSTVLVRNGGGVTLLNPTDDTWISEREPFRIANADAGVASLYFGREGAQTGGRRIRSLIKFDVSGGPDNPAQVRLRMLLQSKQAPSIVVGCFRCNHDWAEGTVSWSSQPGTDQLATAQFALTPTTTVPGWVECDVTALYNAWKTGPNYGCLLRDDETNPGNLSFFASKEFNFSGNYYKPQLIIVASGDSYEEVDATIDPAPGQYAIHYGTGRLRFNQADAGKTIQIDYRGLGSPVDAQDFLVDVPANSSAPGGHGRYAVDGSHAYFHTGSEWKRVALSSF